MEFKVRAVSSGEEKSIQEREQELLDSKTDEVKTDEVKTDDEPVDIQVKEEDILSFMSKKYGKEVKSLDDLMKQPEVVELDLPEDVKAYAKYKKETGRGIEDFMKLNKDLDKVSPERLLKDYLSETNPEFDDEDVAIMMKEYAYDADVDDEDEVSKKRLAQKRKIAEAKSYFAKQKETYSVPIESKVSAVPEAEKEEYERYKRYMTEATTLEEENKRRVDYFLDKTSSLFGDGFKGFEFTVDDQKFVYNPSDAAELKKIQSDPSGFAKKFLDDQGLLSDAEGYHKALAVARNPEKFAKFFFEQGKAMALDKTMKDMKNIDMKERKQPEMTSKGGLRVRSTSEPSGRGLKIRT
jgi:hypothetical protein